MVLAEVRGKAWSKEILPGEVVHGIDYEWIGPRTAIGRIDKRLLRSVAPDPRPGLIVRNAFPWPIKLLEFDVTCGVSWYYTRADQSLIAGWYARASWALHNRARLFKARLRATAFIWGFTKTAY